jgi:hypothetical protein
MADDLQKKSKADLIKLVEELKAANVTEPALVEPPVDPSVNGDSTQKLVEALTSALLATRHAPKSNEPDATTFRLENVSGMALGIEVTNERTGQIKTFSLSRRGEFCMLTLGEIAELREKAPHFFQLGYVHVPHEGLTNPNVVRNIDEFVDSLEYETIDARIGTITSLDTLFAIYNHIENKRFLSEDSNGQPLTERQGDKQVLVLKEQKIGPKYMAALVATKQRIEALSIVKVSLDSK